MVILVSILSGYSFCYADAGDNTDSNYSPKGLSPYKEYSGFIPNEHIDPFSGALTLTIPIISLPQNGGWNLNINLVYNSNIYKFQSFDVIAEDSWVGVGWTLDMGRLIAPGTTRPVVEMPDGSSHPCYGSSVSGPWRTRENWLLSKITDQKYELKLTDGMTYTFEYPGSTVIVDSPYDTRNYFPTSKIKDTCNNEVSITNVAVQTQAGAKAYIDYITDSCSRTIDFVYSASSTASSYLDYITANGRTYDFTYYTATAMGKYKLLTNVTMPESAKWQFTYDVTQPIVLELNELLTPTGAKIKYELITKSFTDTNNSNKTLSYRVVSNKVISGDCTGGTWTYDYTTESTMHKTTVQSPLGKKEEYFLFGYLSAGSGTFWTTGLLDHKITYDSGAEIQRDNYTWHNINVVSNTNIGSHEDSTIYNPVIKKHEIKRNSSTYTTQINDTDFDTYGRPLKITETGENTRTTNRTYWNNLSSSNLISEEFVKDETVTVDGESFTNSKDYYETGTPGKLKTKTLSGVSTSYTYNANGNLSTITDANSHVTTYQSYSYGIPKDIYNAEYPSNPETREVNWEGSIKSVTDREGKKTSYLYDNLDRVTTIDPPVGDDTIIAYDSKGTFVKKTTGAHVFYTFYDCLGLKTSTYEPTLKSCTDITYDALGRKSTESYPYYLETKTATTRSVTDISQAAFGGGIQNGMPEPPTNLRATCGETYIDAAWDCPTTDATFTIGWRRSNDSTYTDLSTPLTARNYRIPGTPGTCYVFRVKAVNNMGETRWVQSFEYISNPCTTQDTTPPDQPSNFRVTETGYSYFRLGWNGSSASDLKGYRIEALKGSNCMQIQGTNTWYLVVDENNCPIGTTTRTVTGLQEDCYYKFRIRAVDVNNNMSPWLEFSTWAKTGYNTSIIHPPTNVNACRYRDGSSYGVRVTWSPPNYTGNIKGYRVYLYRTNGSYYYYVSGASSNSFSLGYTYTTGNWRRVAVKSLSLDDVEGAEVSPSYSTPYPLCQ